MKKFRKAIGAIAVCIAMSASYLVDAAVTPIVTNDLTDITEADVNAINNTQLTASTDNETSTEDIGNGKWFNVGGVNTAGDIATTGGVEKSDEGGVKFTNVNSGIARKIVSGENPTTGIYQIKFSVKPNGSKFAADTTGTLGALYKQYTASDSPTRQRSIMVNISEEGVVYIPVAANPIMNTSNSWYIAKGNPSDWYDITATYNLTSKKLGVSVKQKGEVIAAANNISGLGGDINTYGFGFVRFIATVLGSESPVIKDVTIDSCETADLEFTGYGDKMEYKAGISATGTVENAVKQAGWAVAYKTGNTFTFNGSALEILSGGTTAGTAIGLNSIKPDGADAVKGKLHFAYRIKVEGETSGASIRVNLRDTANKPQSIQFGTDGNIKAAGLTDGTLGTGDVATLGKFDKSEWLDVDEYVDTDGGKYTVVVKQNNAVIAKADDLIAREDIKNNGVNNIHFIFNTAKEDTKLTIDEVSLEKVDAFPTDFTFIDKTGDASWEDVYNQKSGWSKLTSHTYPVAPIEGEAADYSKLSLVKAEGVSVLTAGYNLPQVIKNGTVTIDYDLEIADGGEFWCDLFPENEGAAKQGSSAPMLTASNAIFGHHNENTEGTNADRAGIGKMAARKFSAGNYHMKVEVVPNQGKYNVLIKDAEGKEHVNEPGLTLYAKVANENYVKLVDGEEASEDSKYQYIYTPANTLKSINFRSSKSSAYIDNLVVAYKAEEASVAPKTEKYSIDKAQLTGSDVTAELTAISGSEAKTLVLYAACYDGDERLVAVKEHEVKIAADSTIYEPVKWSFDEEPTGWTTFKVFMWNNDVTPYCPAYDSGKTVE